MQHTLTRNTFYIPTILMNVISNTVYSPDIQLLASLHGQERCAKRLWDYACGQLLSLEFCNKDYLNFLFRELKIS